jgi:hypothetical protein
MYGTVGLLALEGLQLLPVARVVWFPSGHGGKEGVALRSALAAALLMSAIDNLLNGSMILPLLLVIGGLSAEGVALSAGVVSQGRVVPQPAPAAKSSSTPVILRRSVAGTRIAKLP